MGVELAWTGEMKTILSLSYLSGFFILDSDFLIQDLNLLEVIYFSLKVNIVMVIAMHEKKLFMLRASFHP